MQEKRSCKLSGSMVASCNPVNRQTDNPLKPGCDPPGKLPPLTGSRLSAKLFRRAFHFPSIRLIPDNIGVGCKFFICFGPEKSQCEHMIRCSKLLLFSAKLRRSKSLKFRHLKNALKVFL